ncbi:MAG TPA: hypothetical protein ENJ56_00460 [Anaerolineae bacterium]|nr:hypothetical protein [Anaerolineae bacterium]
MKRHVDPNLNKQQHSFLHRLRIGLGFTFVPPSHVQVVLRNEKFHRLLPPDYHYVFRFRDVLGPLISTGMKIKSVEDIICRSKNAISFSITARILYKFDPAACDKEILSLFIQSEIDPNKNIPINETINNIVQDKTGNVIRLVAGNYTEAELSSGITLKNLQSVITTQLIDELALFGVSLIEQVAILQIIPLAPTTDAARVTESAIGWRRMAEQLDSVDSDTAQQILDILRMKHFGSSGGRIRLDGRPSTPSSDDGSARSGNNQSGIRPNTPDSYK